MVLVNYVARLIGKSNIDERDGGWKQSGGGVGW